MKAAIWRSHKQTKMPKLLVVEDDEGARAALGDILDLEGYDVALSANGAEALEYLHNEPLPDLIILDLQMPVMNGWQFRREQNKDAEFAAVPVIVITAFQSRRRYRCARDRAQADRYPAVAGRWSVNYCWQHIPTISVFDSSPVQRMRAAVFARDLRHGDEADARGGCEYARPAFPASAGDARVRSPADASSACTLLRQRGRIDNRNRPPRFRKPPPATTIPAGYRRDWSRIRKRENHRGPR